MTTKCAMIAVVVAMCFTARTAPVRADDASKYTEPVAAQPATQPETPATSQAITTPTLALQPEENQQKDKWVFNSPLYVWAAGLQGSVTAKGRTADIDASASDIFKHADFGFQGYFELAKPKCGFYAQPTYMKLSDSAHARIFKADDTLELWIVEFGAFYKVVDWQGEHRGSLAALAGGRYWGLHNELTIKDTSIPATVKGIQSESLIDPIIGMRYEQYLTKKLHLWSQGDIGGFDISNSQSRFSWQVMPLLGYDFTMPAIHKPSTVFAGYRVIGVQHTEGSGANKQAFNLRMEGALIGLNVVLF